MQRGAPFAAVAQQFSSAPSSVAGGDLGWMSAGEMRPEMEAVVASLQPGQVSTPIPAPGGYLIVLLRDRREGKPPADRLRLREVVLAADDSARARASEALERARRQISGCDGLDATVQKVAPGARIIDLGEVRDIDLSDLYRNALSGVAAGRASAPFATQDGANMLVVCTRVAETGDAAPTRAQIEDRLYEQELGMLARRYLRDLRRDSAIITR
jgi:peptidyl-prolyl cis-trans isomerase SurA